eukprot:3637514-Amphidinium_carterae.1
MHRQSKLSWHPYGAPAWSCWISPMAPIDQWGSQRRSGKSGGVYACQWPGNDRSAMLPKQFGPWRAGHVSVLLGRHNSEHKRHVQASLESAS